MATVKVEILAWLARELALSDSSSTVFNEDLSEGDTVGTLLARLSARHERFARLVFDPKDGRTYEHVAVLLNGRVVEAQGGLAAHLRDGDRLTLLPGFAGG